MKNIDYVLVHGGLCGGAAGGRLPDPYTNDWSQRQQSSRSDDIVEDDVAVTNRTLAGRTDVYNFCWGPFLLVEAVILKPKPSKGFSASYTIVCFAPDQGESVGSLINEDPPAGHARYRRYCSRKTAFVSRHRQVFRASLSQGPT